MKVQWLGLTTTKAGNQASENEDALAISLDNGRVAVCDGASEGWSSGAWARHLAKSLVETPTEPRTFHEWVVSARATAVFQAAPVVSWYAEEKSAAGAFSTLLQVVFSTAKDGGYRYHAAAVGDTNLFHLQGERLVARFPLDRSTDFSNRPKLVGSAPDPHPDAEFFAGRAESGDRFYLTTDALAEWFLQQAEAGEQPWGSLDAVTSALDPHAEFAHWVQSQREQKHMKNDDTTLVRVRIL